MDSREKMRGATAERAVRNTSSSSGSLSLRRALAVTEHMRKCNGLLFEPKASEFIDNE